MGFSHAAEVRTTGLSNSGILTAAFWAEEIKEANKGPAGKNVKFCLTRQEDINARDGGVRQEKQLKQPHWISFMYMWESAVSFVVSGKDSDDFDVGGRNRYLCFR